MHTDQLIESLAASATPVKAARSPWRIGVLWLCFAIAYLVVLLGATGMRPDLVAQLHAPLFAAEIAMLGMIIAACALAAAVLSFPDMHQKRWVLLLPPLCFAVFIALMCAAFIADNPPSPMPDHSMECLLCIALYTLLPTAWMLYAMRKLASTHGISAGAMALLCAFSIGALALRLSEQTDSIAHIVQWHYAPMVAVMVIGFGAGRLWLKW